MGRRVLMDERGEDWRWALIMLLVAISGADPLVQRFWEGCYRIGWWIRRRADRLRGQLVDGMTAVGNLYVRAVEWTEIRYRRWRPKG